MPSITSLEDNSLNRKLSPEPSLSVDLHRIPPPPHSYEPTLLPCRPLPSSSSSAVAAQPTSFLGSICVLTATTVGAGLLSLPICFHQVGWLLGSLLIIFNGLVSHHCIGLLVRGALLVGAKDYEELCFRCFGERGRTLLRAHVLVLIFGCLCAFQVIIGDTVTAAVQSIANDDSSFATQRGFLLSLVACLIVFPICLLRSVHALEKYSFVAVGILVSFSVIIFMRCIVFAITHSLQLDHVVEGRLDVTDFFNALPTIALAFSCQMMVLPVFNALSIPTEAQMSKVTGGAMSLCTILYVFVGFSGYLLYSDGVQGDILNNLPQDGAYDAVRLFFAVAICIHFPVVHFAFRESLLTMAVGAREGEPFNRIRHVSLTAAVVLITLVIAIVLKDLQTVFGLTGALTSYQYCFIIPCVAYLKANRMFWSSVHSDSPPDAQLDEEEREKGEGEGGVGHASEPQGFVQRVEAISNQKYSKLNDEEKSNGAASSASSSSSSSSSSHSGALGEGVLPLTRTQTYVVYCIIGCSVVAAGISIYATGKDFIQSTF